MDSSRTSLPNVDRANSTLFKRYLDEQQKSVTTTSHHQTLSRPMNSTIQITHTHREQRETFTTKSGNTSITNQQVIVKRKYSKGRKPSADSSKQRTSHTSRFMKRFQRQHKTGETIANVQKRDGRPRFEFHEPLPMNPIRTDQEPSCRCMASSDRPADGHPHQPHCPRRGPPLPRLSFNELLHQSSEHRRQPAHGPVAPPSTSPMKSILPPVINHGLRQEPTSNKTHFVEPAPPPSSSSIVLSTESEVFRLDDPSADVPNEHWPFINDLLQEISTEMTDKPSVDMLFEIEESLAQRIYDCVVERDEDEGENENEVQSYSSITHDSSAPSAPPPLNNLSSHESIDLPPSPINITARKPVESRDKYFQPIREQPPPPPPFHTLLDRNQHSTPFQRLPRPTHHDTHSPFAQSLFEPVNLLRTVAAGDTDEFHFFPSSFSFDHQPSAPADSALFPPSKSELPTATYPHPLPFLNHLLPPRTTPVNTTVVSAFKPIEPVNIRTSTSFALKRPSVVSSSTGTHWFGQS